ncbi:class I SAM-dependent methyltransferase [Candidatus Parcubacteria bacterium]|nr:class I SAM-dependent methyltransferase [Candidatus Parcubacteria bacterium]
MSLWQKLGLTNKMTRERLARFVARYASEQETLDIGCGGAPYAKYFPHRIGFDHAAGPGVDVVGDAHALLFPDNYFERILCTEVLEHLIDPPKAVAEMRRVLKPGGLLILTTRFVFPIHDAPHDYWRFTRFGLEHLFRDWEIVELVEEAGSLGTLAVLAQRLGLQVQFYGGRLTKLFILAGARLLQGFSWLVRVEYGDVTHAEQAKHPVLVSGYYLAARRRNS